MIKAVYDTNVLVSGLLSRKGTPAHLVDIVKKELIKLILSEDILEEYQEVLMRPEFEFSRRDVKMFLNKLRANGKIVKPKTTIKILSDPSDNKFLECALTGKAEYLVTGNTKDFPFNSFRGIKIVSPRDFWNVYITRKL